MFVQNDKNISQSFECDMSHHIKVYLLKLIKISLPDFNYFILLIA